MARSHRARLKRSTRIAATSLLVIVIALQFIRLERPQGALPGDGRMTDFVAVPGKVDSLLRRSCYDCHSDETRWPWYSRVAPISWLITHDVQHGRSDLDFSRWSIDPIREPTPQQRFRWMCRDVRRGIMPPRVYLLAHPRARLTDADRETLCAWADQQLSAGQPRDGHETAEPRCSPRVMCRTGSRSNPTTIAW